MPATVTQIFIDRLGGTVGTEDQKIRDAYDAQQNQNGK